MKEKEYKGDITEKGNRINCNDERILEQTPSVYCGKEAKEIEQDLAVGIVKQEALDKKETLDNDLADLSVEHLAISPLFKEFSQCDTRTSSSVPI